MGTFTATMNPSFTHEEPMVVRPTKRTARRSVVVFMGAPCD
jgi:hypothetical protein